MSLPLELNPVTIPDEAGEPNSFAPGVGPVIPGAAKPALSRELVCSTPEGEEEDDFDDEDFDDDFDDDFEDELDEELNDDLDEFDEDIEEGAEIGGDSDDEEAEFEDEDF